MDSPSKLSFAEPCALCGERFVLIALPSAACSRCADTGYASPATPSADAACAFHKTIAPLATDNP